MRTIVKGIATPWGMVAVDIPRVGVPSWREASDSGGGSAISGAIYDRPGYDLIGFVPTTSGRASEGNHGRTKVTCQVRVDGPGQLQHVRLNFAREGN
jgi:hypothetical protein